MMMPNGHDAEWKIQTEVTHKRNSIPNNHPHFPELRSDVSDMPWGCPQFCVAAVSQKLLPYNIIAFKYILKLKLYNIIKYFIMFYI